MMMMRIDIRSADAGRFLDATHGLSAAAAVASAR